MTLLRLKQLDLGMRSAVYLKLQKNSEERAGKYDKTLTIQRCGLPPYELSLRMAGCNLHCVACFASGYSWPERYTKHRLVKPFFSFDEIKNDFGFIPTPPSRNYNWLRVLGGEPLLNDSYIDFLFDALNCLSNNAAIFNNGIIIQTNGIYLGAGNTETIERRLLELYDINPDVIVTIECSIKGTNEEEFALLTQSKPSLFSNNLNCYYKLREIDAPNLRATIIAGFGISESYLLTEGEAPKTMMTVLFDDLTPTFHPSIWSAQFKKLYGDFTSAYISLDSSFARMPMYGIKDQFGYGWVKRAVKQAKEVYSEHFYDAKYAKRRNLEIEAKFADIIDRFFLVDNQTYYSMLIKRS